MRSANISIEDQAREGVSLEMQQSKLEAYTMINDWTMLGVNRDEGASAKSFKRRGSERPLAIATAGEVQAVVI